MIEDLYTLNRTIEERLFNLSHYRKDNFVTPVMLEYFTLRFHMGFNEEYAIGRLEAKYMNTQIVQADWSL